MVSLSLSLSLWFRFVVVYIGLIFPLPSPSPFLSFPSLLPFSLSLCWDLEEGLLDLNLIWLDLLSLSNYVYCSLDLMKIQIYFLSILESEVRI